MTTELPPPVAAAARAAGEHLRTALLPHVARVAEAGPQLEALWQAAKLLSAAGGELELPDTPAEETVRARWAEVAECAAAVTDLALTAAVDGLDLEQAQGRLLNADILRLEVPDGAGAYAGVIALTPQDAIDVDPEKTLTVQIGGTFRNLTVTDDATGPASRAHTPATLARTAHHLHQLGKVLGEAVLDDPGEGSR